MTATSAAGDHSNGGLRGCLGVVQKTSCTLGLQTLGQVGVARFFGRFKAFVFRARVRGRLQAGSGALEKIFSRAV
jgi:hypothetical protein